MLADGLRESRQWGDERDRRRTSTGWSRPVSATRTARSAAPPSAADVPLVGHRHHEAGLAPGGGTGSACRPARTPAGVAPSVIVSRESADARSPPTSTQRSDREAGHGHGQDVVVSVRVRRPGGWSGPSGTSPPRGRAGRGPRRCPRCWAGSRWSARSGCPAAPAGAWARVGRGTERVGHAPGPRASAAPPGRPRRPATTAATATAVMSHRGRRDAAPVCPGDPSTSTVSRRAVVSGPCRSWRG